MSQKYNQQIIKRNQRKRLIRIFTKWRKQGCKRCGFSDWRAIDAHHINREKKRSSIPRLIRNGVSAIKLLEELRLCESLCKNCHAIHHHEDGTWEREQNNDQELMIYLPGLEIG